MEKKTTTIYPYSKDDIQLFRYAKLIGDIQPVYAVSPPGWGLIGKDATAIDGGKPSGIVITENLDSALQNSELLVIASFEHYVGEEGGLKDTLETAIQYKKPFVLLSPPQTPEEQIALETAKQLGLLHWSSEQDHRNIIALANEKDDCDELKSPVTLIVGQGPYTSKFETQLGVRQELIKRGYKVSQIGSRPYCELFGFHSFPSFMFSKELDETQKIITLNQFVKQIENEEEPDLIIVCVPGGIMPVFEKAHNNFGILHVEVSAAIEPDSVIYNLYSNEYSTQFYEKSAEMMYHRLNHVKTNCFIMSGSWIDYGAHHENKEFRIIKFDKPYNKIIEKPEEVPSLSIFEKNVFEKATDAVVAVLEGYNLVDHY